MPYSGGYGKVASSMKRKRAMNKYGSPDDNSRMKPRKFSDGGGSQKVPPNVGVPNYKYGDSTSGEPQDRKAARMRPPMSKGRKTPTNLGRPANEPTQGNPRGPRSPMPKYQDGGKNPVKREAMGAASGFRSFQSIIKGNVMGMRPPKKLAKNMQPVKGKTRSYTRKG